MSTSSPVPLSLSSLTPDQKEALETLQAVTGLSEVPKALGILVKYRWNAERAIHNVLDGNVDDVEEVEVDEDAGDEGPGGDSNGGSSSSEVDASRGEGSGSRDKGKQTVTGAANDRPVNDTGAGTTVSICLGTWPG